MAVTARFEDGTAGVYNTVAEALDQAVYDEECGFRKLKDVIQGEYTDHRSDDANKARKVAGRDEVNSHRTEWRTKWGVVAGNLMPRAKADEQLQAERADAKTRAQV